LGWAGNESIWEDLADVLARPRLQKKYTDLVAPERRERFIALVRALAVMVETQTRLDVVSDKADNQVLAGAVDGATFLSAGWPLRVRVSASSPGLWPTMFSVT